MILGNALQWPCVTLQVVDALQIPCIKGACGNRELDLTNLIFPAVFSIKIGGFDPCGGGVVPGSSESIPAASLCSDLMCGPNSMIHCRKNWLHPPGHCSHITASPLCTPHWWVWKTAGAEIIHVVFSVSVSSWIRFAAWHYVGTDLCSHKGQVARGWEWTAKAEKGHRRGL